MANELLRRLIRRVGREDSVASVYSEPPVSFAEQFPNIPKPESRLSPERIAAQWMSHSLYGEQMPGIAADLLEAGHDTPSLRRLAGEIGVTCSADVEEIVGKAFRELGIRYPISEKQAKLMETRQIAREVIAGQRNPWAAGSHLEIVIWHWEAGTPDLQDLFGINDELEWDRIHRRSLTDLRIALIELFARIAAMTDTEILQP